MSTSRFTTNHASARRLWRTGQWGALRAGLPTSVTISAGGITVLTTAPASEVNTDLVPAGANLVSLGNVPENAPADSHRIFSGTTEDVSTNSFAGFNRLFNVSLRPRNSSLTDYESAVVLYNTNGILESFVGLPIVISGGNVPALHFVVSDATVAGTIGNMAAGNRYYVRGGSLRGNSTAGASPASTEGDPRALNEQLEFRIYETGGAPDQTRFFTSDLANNSVPAQSTMGAPNANYVRPSNWVDLSSINAGPTNAPLIVSNAAMQTIGELGHITDPARLPGTSGALADVAFSRGGGRTLRVGQAEHARWYDGNQTNASRTWTSWRLADIFTVRSNYPANSATNGVANAVNVRIPGLINPNGALRDNGAAMRSALFGLTFQQAPEGASGTANRAVNIGGIVTNMITRLTNGAAAGLGTGTINPFWERGEFSELPLFNSPPPQTAALGANMSNTFDRGREELVRRTIEMLTARGSVFSVYAVGQSLQVTTNSTNILGTVRVKSTFEISPQFANVATATNDAFNPTNALQAPARFQPPTNYSSRVVSSFYD